MKTQKLLFSLGLALSLSAGAAMAAGDHKHSHAPQHGGVVVEAADADFELVAQAELITLYVRGHGKAAATTAGATGKLTLLSGSEKTEAALLPAGGNKLEAKGRFKVGSGTKAVALVTLAGKKPVNLRFAIK